ncbi:U32 family peptidase C-terminal domain-containing protein, partial [Treponema sp. OttesenSCG-928-L16]|nr:U32 family peptidase C-terminal domain-containing protein [Treponema sp. OttesenSCG-928-L16]
SRYMAGRSANQGHCAHSCRWEYRVLEERERPGEYFPAEEGDKFTSILSSRDLCMVDHLRELRDAGVDAVKIEGRMKSLYYTAVITRAYRKHLDALAPSPGSRMPRAEELAFFREELFKVSHREFSTGFYFGKEEIETPTLKTYLQSHIFLGLIGAESAPPGGTSGNGASFFKLEVNNKIIAGEELQFIGPDLPLISGTDYLIRDEEGNPVPEADHGKRYILETPLPLKEGYIIRRPVHPEETASPRSE